MTLSLLAVRKVSNYRELILCENALMILTTRSIYSFNLNKEKKRGKIKLLVNKSKKIMKSKGSICSICLKSALLTEQVDVVTEQALTDHHRGRR